MQALDADAWVKVLERKKGMGLTAQERETVINMNDEENTALITTYQRPLITKLRKNPAAKLIKELSFDKSMGAVFEIPAELLTFRTGKRAPRAARPGAAERMNKARAAKKAA
jgi:hypothetical protein